MASPYDGFDSLSDTPSGAKRPGRWKPGRWLVAVGCAGGLLALQATAAFAMQIKPGGRYEGTIVACSTQQEAETLRGFVVAGDVAKAKAYLEADDNSCGAGGPIPFVVMQEVSDAKADAKGNEWRIVKIALPTAEAYLLTTADLVVSQNT